MTLALLLRLLRAEQYRDEDEGGFRGTTRPPPLGSPRIMESTEKLQCGSWVPSLGGFKVSPGRVLIVDDALQFARTLQTVLSGYGYAAVWVGTGEAAMEKLRSELRT